MNNIDLTVDPLFDLRATVYVDATADSVYAMVSDLSRSGDWSPECTGGQWISGEPGTVGAVFEGKNLRSAAVVAWAPVVRGAWTTESEVVAAVPGQTFQWAIRAKSGAKQESVWGFDLAASAGRTLLTHHYRMGRATEGIQGITADMDDAEKARFFADWRVKVHADIEATVARIKELIESDQGKS